MFFDYFSKMGKTVFDLYKGNMIFYSFFSVFAFKQAKEQLFFQV